jgi:hypothetical protein
MVPGERINILRNGYKDMSQSSSYRYFQRAKKSRDLNNNHDEQRKKLRTTIEAIKHVIGTKARDKSDARQNNNNTRDD